VLSAPPTTVGGTIGVFQRDGTTLTITQLNLLITGVQMYTTNGFDVHP
jgi:hypothetical protein